MGEEGKGGVGGTARAFEAVVGCAGIRHIKQGRIKLLEAVADGT